VKNHPRFVKVYRCAAVRAGEEDLAFVGVELPTALCAVNDVDSRLLDHVLIIAIIPL
jgi:hypothetical protein